MCVWLFLSFFFFFPGRARIRGSEAQIMPPRLYWNSGGVRRYTKLAKLAERDGFSGATFATGGASLIANVLWKWGLGNYGNGFSFPFLLGLSPFPSFSHSSPV